VTTDPDNPCMVPSLKLTVRISKWWFPSSESQNFQWFIFRFHVNFQGCIFTYMKTIKINHPCRYLIYQSHGWFGRGKHSWVVQNSRLHRCSSLAGLVTHYRHRHCFRLLGQPLLVPSASQNGRQQFDWDVRAWFKKIHKRVVRSWRHW